MTLYLRLAWRNIWRHRRRTIIIVLAMSLTLALMMFYDGLMNGFKSSLEIVENSSPPSPQFTLKSREVDLARVPGVAPVVLE